MIWIVFVFPHDILSFSHSHALTGDNITKRIQKANLDEASPKSFSHASVFGLVVKANPFQAPHLCKGMSHYVNDIYTYSIIRY